MLTSGTIPADETNAVMRFVADDLLGWAARAVIDSSDQVRVVTDLATYTVRITVFNTAQCDGLPDDLSVVTPPLPEGLVLPQAEGLIRATSADLRLGGEQAFYSVGADFIQVPRPESFFEPVNWHRTALHELAHWSGAAGRLEHDLAGRFGSRAYAREELVAEIASAFLCASLDIVPTVRHADYVGDWLQVLREDNRAIVRAASAATKAADYLLAFAPDAAPSGEVMEDADALGRVAA